MQKAISKTKPLPYVKAIKINIKVDIGSPCVKDTLATIQ
jgi:hypothetical protein